MGSLNQCRLEGFICRLCSLLNRDKDVIHIYGNEGTAKNLENKINIYLQINLSKFDPLPKVICTSCDIKLEQHHRFMQKVIENQKKIEQRQAEIINRREQRVMPLGWILRQRQITMRPIENDRHRRQQRTATLDRLREQISNSESIASPVIVAVPENNSSNNISNSSEDSANRNGDEDGDGEGYITTSSLASSSSSTSSSSSSSEEEEEVEQEEEDEENEENLDEEHVDSDFDEIADIINEHTSSDSN